MDSLQLLYGLVAVIGALAAARYFKEPLRHWWTSNDGPEMPKTEKTQTIADPTFMRADLEAGSYIVHVHNGWLTLIKETLDDQGALTELDLVQQIEVNS